MDEHEALVKKAVAEHSVVALVGGLDSGKTTLSRQMMREALGAGRIPAYLDADLGQKSVGPPTTVGLKLIRSEEDLDPARMVLADACYFVGAISPQGNLLPVVTGVARLLQRARADGADFVVLDTSGLISGVYGQLLKYHEFELARPDLVVGLQRGEELEPLLGIVQRFLPGEVVTLGVPAGVVPASVEQRAARPSDGEGEYVGIGYLEHTPEEGILRLISPVADAPRALRLGSVRLEEGLRAKRVDLRNLLGAD